MAAADSPEKPAGGATSLDAFSGVNVQKAETVSADGRFQAMVNRTLLPHFKPDTAGNNLAGKRIQQFFDQLGQHLAQNITADKDRRDVIQKLRLPFSKGPFRQCVLAGHIVVDHFPVNAKEYAKGFEEQMMNRVPREELARFKRQGSTTTFNPPPPQVQASPFAESSPTQQAAPPNLSTSSYGFDASAPSVPRSQGAPTTEPESSDTNAQQFATQSPAPALAAPAQQMQMQQSFTQMSLEQHAASPPTAAAHAPAVQPATGTVNQFQPHCQNHNDSRGHQPFPSQSERQCQSQSQSHTQSVAFESAEPSQNHGHSHSTGLGPMSESTPPSHSKQLGQQTTGPATPPPPAAMSSPPPAAAPFDAPATSPSPAVSPPPPAATSFSASAPAQQPSNASASASQPPPQRFPGTGGGPVVASHTAVAPPTTADAAPARHVHMQAPQTTRKHISAPNPSSPVPSAVTSRTVGMRSTASVQSVTSQKCVEARGAMDTCFKTLEDNLTKRNDQPPAPRPPRSKSRSGAHSTGGHRQHRISSSRSAVNVGSGRRGGASDSRAARDWQEQQAHNNGAKYGELAEENRQLKAELQRLKSKESFDKETQTSKTMEEIEQGKKDLKVARREAEEEKKKFIQKTMGVQSEGHRLSELEHSVRAKTVELNDLQQKYTSLQNARRASPPPSNDHERMHLQRQVKKLAAECEKKQQTIEHLDAVAKQRDAATAKQKHRADMDFSAQGAEQVQFSPVPQHKFSQNELYSEMKIPQQVRHKPKDGFFDDSSVDVGGFEGSAQPASNHMRETSSTKDVSREPSPKPEVSDMPATTTSSAPHAHPFSTSKQADLFDGGGAAAGEDDFYASLSQSRTSPPATSPPPASAPPVNQTQAMGGADPFGGAQTQTQQSFGGAADLFGAPTGNSPDPFDFVSGGQVEPESNSNVRMAHDGHANDVWSAGATPPTAGSWGRKRSDESESPGQFDAASRMTTPAFYEDDIPTSPNPSCPERVESPPELVPLSPPPAQHEHDRLPPLADAEHFRPDHWQQQDAGADDTQQQSQPERKNSSLADPFGDATPAQQNQLTRKATSGSLSDPFARGGGGGGAQSPSEKSVPGGKDPFGDAGGGGGKDMFGSGGKDLFGSPGEDFSSLIGSGQGQQQQQPPQAAPTHAAPPPAANQGYNAGFAPPPATNQGYGLDPQPMSRRAPHQQQQAHGGYGQQQQAQQGQPQAQQHVQTSPFG